MVLRAYFILSHFVYYDTQDDYTFFLWCDCLIPIFSRQ
jgi:hypothetical protein